MFVFISGRIANAFLLQQYGPVISYSGNNPIDELENSNCESRRILNGLLEGPAVLCIASSKIRNSFLVLEM